MTKNFKGIIQMCFVAVFIIAISLGTSLLINTQTARAADQAVTISAAYIEGDNVEKEGYLQVRMDTNVQTWTNSQNNKTVSELPSSIVNYTTINGRTLTEIEDASTSDLPVLVTLQPAGSFSFIRVWVPLDFMTSSMVRSVGVLDGWAFNDGTANFTSSEVTFIRDGGTMVAKSAYASTAKVESSAISISKACLSLPDDSYIVDINIGVNMSGLSYEVMGDSCESVRNAIYINGKSINEWNTQLRAQDARFSQASTYAKFPQNSTEVGHEKFIRPIALYGTSTGFTLRLLQEVFSACETVTVKVGTGCYHTSFMVVGNKSENVLEQIDITEKLGFLDNTINDNSNNTTNAYHIHTNNEVIWSQAPIGGCLNEYDPLQDKGIRGGQIQMKYIYFNGTSLYDINKTDDGAYGSEQGAIKNNGGQYAPILVEMTEEVGSSLRIRVPMSFTNGKAGHEEFIVKKGFNVMVGDKSYYVSQDVIFTNTGSGWTKEIKANEIATSVTKVITYANRTDGGTNENFVLFELSNNDYAGLNTQGIADVSSLLGYIEIDGVLLESIPNEPFFNVWGIPNTVAFRAPGLDANGLQQVRYITIKAGAKFPAYTTQNGGKATYYVTQEDVTFVHNVPYDTWTVGEVPAETPKFTLTFKVGDTVFSTIEVEDVDGETEMFKDVWDQIQALVPAKAEDANYTYEFSAWRDVASGKLVDGSSTGIRKATTITEDMTFVAEFTATEKPSGDIDITSELTFIHQAQQNVGTEVYMIRTQSNYWTKTPLGGCLNEYDVDGLTPVGGQIQMKNIYFNGKSLYEINREDDGSYGSLQGNIANGGQYAPIVVFMGSDNGAYSYIQLHVPTAYPNAEASVNDNHKSIEIKEGFSVTENDKTYVVTEDIKWVNLNGVWTNENNLLASSEVSVSEGAIDGEKGELLRVELTSSAWNFNRDPVDYNYYSAERFISMRRNIYVNGVSLFEINTTVDDSSYNYVTFPQTHSHTATYNGVEYDTFANPVYLFGEGNVLKVYIHLDYFKTLGAGDITVTVKAGFEGQNGKDGNGNDVMARPLAEDVTKVVSKNCLVTIDGISQVVIKNKALPRPSNPQKDMDSDTYYEFENWYVVGTDTIFNFDNPITDDVDVESRYVETTINMIETEVKAVVHHLRTERQDSWMVFELSNNDYTADLNTTPIPGGYDELLRIGFLDKVILKGSLESPTGIVSQATLKDVYDWFGPQENPYFNIWGQVGSLALRVPVGAGIEEIVVETGCFFPSYNYLSGKVTVDTRYVVRIPATYIFNEEVTAYNKQAAVKIDITMEKGAAVRLTTDTTTSGLRFQTNVSKASVEELRGLLNNKTYDEISFGTLIVPTDYLMGGFFSHEWLDKNGFSYLDIKSTANLDAWATETETHCSFFGSIVNLKTSNLDRAFSGIGYVKLTKGDKVIYVYAPYDSANSRSAAFVAKAATEDRSDAQSNDYSNEISTGSWSPYTVEEHEFLAKYITWTEKKDAIEPVTLTYLASKGGTQEIEPVVQKLDGAYVELVYSTNVNVWGVFTYTDGTKTANEDFYLQAGTSIHKQFLDIYRENGVGLGMDANNISMTKITFTNAELAESDAPEGKVKILGLYSSNKTIDMENQEIYLTVTQNDGSEMTVGAHLGLGGALTYLAKSGIYEGVTASGYRSGEVKLQTNTSGFVSERNINLFGTSKEAGYYGSATSSRPEDGAVNLINNVDAGRQIQQSWYAAVDTENNYTRAFCKTESSAGKYWPYNPVQAGDVVSNPSQIIDYEINTSRGYIYVKTRAMDWAKGKGTDNLTNTISGGSTTKSYMENYYRLGKDGTLTVNNSYIDWNGFTDMAGCDWASTELPAVYPVHTLNYYVSNLDGDGTWTDGLEYNNGLSGWTGGNACRQGTVTNSDIPYTMVENWFAWANGGDGNAFALGMYIPNVSRLTSGRTRTTIGMSESLNRNAISDNTLSEKGLMSNMQPIKYTYQSAYVSNTSYTAPGISFRMEAYKKIEYSYVICLGTVDSIRQTFYNIYTNGTITNAGSGYEKVGLDAWARADKIWTW